MDVSRQLAPLRFCAAVVLLLVVATPADVRAAEAGIEEVACELKIRGHSMVRLTLVKKTRHSGIQFDKPGETVQLPAGKYRVEQVELEEGAPARARGEYPSLLVTTN